MYVDLRVKFPLISLDFNKNPNFHDRFSKFSQISNAMKTNPSKTELFHADGQMARKTDMTKLRVAYHNFANWPRYSTFRSHSVFMCCKLFLFG